MFISNPEEVESVLSKFYGKHQFLTQYKPKSSLQATIIGDLVISLAPNHDIAFNMLNVLTKMWSPSDPSTSGAQSTIGYIEFLSNLVESMQTFAANSGKVVSCLSFLSETILPTNSKALLSYLSRQDNLCKLNETLSSDYFTPEKLKVFVATFSGLLRNPASSNVFKRLVQFVFNVQRLLQVDNPEPNINTLNELLQLDLRSEIGKLIFNRGICPTDLEAHTCSIHLNLVYELALNLSAPVISIDQDSDKSSIEQLLQNLDNDNIDKSIHSNKKTSVAGEFMCQNAIVFDYLSKHSSLLGYLLQNLMNQRADTERVEFFGCQMNFVENMMSIEQIGVVSNMYEHCTLWTTLSFDSTSERSVSNFLIKTQDAQ